MSNPDTTVSSPLGDAQYAEALRRIALIDAGKMRLIPWEEVEARIFGAEPPCDAELHEETETP